MLLFGFFAIYGFCGALVGSLSLCGVAAEPVNGGSEGVPVSTIGAAEAVAVRARAATVAVGARKFKRMG